VKTRVIKFGGTSVTGGDRIDTIAAVVRRTLETHRPIVVVSAFAKVTILLEQAASAAVRGTHAEAYGVVRGVHADAIRSMTESSAELRASVDELLGECLAHLDLIAEEHTCSPRTLDEILAFGERLSSMIISAALIERGIATHTVDAGDLIITDGHHGDARADLEATRDRLQVMAPRWIDVPIVTGFLGATPSGVRTTLGREGSDYSAAILAWGVHADDVEIWTDVDGVMTSDPRLVSDAHPLRHLTYDELFELSSWGAKVVHPKTVRPLRELGIPLTIRNTLSPSDQGTRVGPSEGEGDQPAQLGVVQLTSDTLDATDNGGRHLLPEDMIALLDEVPTPYSVVTAIGDLHAPGARGRLNGLSESMKGLGVTVHAVLVGSSNRSISYVVDLSAGDAVVRIVHDTLFPGESGAGTSLPANAATIHSDALHA
jgi:aspartate kinase